MRSRVAIVVLMAALAAGFPSPPEEAGGGGGGLLEESVQTAYKFMEGCGEREVSLCLKMRALTLVDRALRRPDDFQIADGVALVRTEAAASSLRGLNGRALSEAELDASLPKDAEDKDATVESLLVDRVARFLQSHTLQLKVPESSINEVRRSLDEARGKKKKLKMLLPFLLMLKLKAAALIPLALGALALLALKALIVGKLALVLSGLIGLQKLLSSKHSTQSYEVVAHPHYSEEHGHYGRSIGESPAQDLAYRGYAPEPLKQE